MKTIGILVSAFTLTLAGCLPNQKGLSPRAKDGSADSLILSTELPKEVNKEMVKSYELLCGDNKKALVGDVDAKKLVTFKTTKESPVKAGDKCTLSLMGDKAQENITWADDKGLLWISNKAEAKADGSNKLKLKLELYKQYFDKEKPEQGEAKVATLIVPFSVQAPDDVHIETVSVPVLVCGSTQYKASVTKFNNNRDDEDGFQGLITVEIAEKDFEERPCGNMKAVAKDTNGKVISELLATELFNKTPFKLKKSLIGKKTVTDEIVLTWQAKVEEEKPVEEKKVSVEVTTGATELHGVWIQDYMVQSAFTFNAENKFKFSFNGTVAAEGNYTVKNNIITFFYKENGKDMKVYTKYKVDGKKLFLGELVDYPASDLVIQTGTTDESKLEKQLLDEFFPYVK